jgi:hypothetical protein
VQPDVVTTSLLLTVTAPVQLSVIVPPCAMKPAESVAAAGIGALHTKVAVGQVITGACVSTVRVIVCVQVDALLQASVIV